MAIYALCMLDSPETYPECVIPTTFLLQQWLYERAAMLRYT